MKLAFGLIFSALSTLAFSASAATSTQYIFPKALEKIEFSMSPAMEGDLALKLAVDLSEQTPTIKGNFSQYTPEGDLKNNCQFTDELTSEESAKLKALIARVRYCKANGPDDMVIDPYYMESVRAFTKKPAGKSGGTAIGMNKYYLVGWSPQRYLCKGGAELYNYMKSLTVNRAPNSCPRQYGQMFAFQAP